MEPCVVGRRPVLAYPGMRVIMNEGYKTQGTGTVISVVDKLSCSVRWDSGRTEQCLFTGKFDMFQLLEVPGAETKIACSRNKNSMPTTHRSDDQSCSWNEGCTSPSVSPRKPRGTSPSMSPKIPRVLNISPRRARTSEDDGPNVNAVRRRTRAGPSLRGYWTPGDVNKEIRCKLAKSLHSPFQKQHGSRRRDLEKTEHTHTCTAHPPKSGELSEDISPGLSHSTNTTDDGMQESWLESSKADRIISFCVAHPPLRRERSNLNNRERWSAVQALIHGLHPDRMRLEVQLPDIAGNTDVRGAEKRGRGDVVVRGRGDVVVRSKTTVGLAVVGLTLDYISPLSPAHLSEKMAVGDEIVEVDACAVSESSFLTYVLGDDTPGSLCNIKAVRADGSEYQVDLLRYSRPHFCHWEKIYHLLESLTIPQKHDTNNGCGEMEASGSSVRHTVAIIMTLLKTVKRFEFARDLEIRKNMHKIYTCTSNFLHSAYLETENAQPDSFDSQVGSSLHAHNSWHSHHNSEKGEVEMLRVHEEKADLQQRLATAIRVMQEQQNQFALQVKEGERERQELLERNLELLRQEADARTVAQQHNDADLIERLAQDLEHIERARALVQHTKEQEQLQRKADWERLLKEAIARLQDQRDAALYDINRIKEERDHALQGKANAEAECQRVRSLLQVRDQELQELLEKDGSPRAQGEVRDQELQEFKEKDHVIKRPLILLKQPLVSLEPGLSCTSQQVAVSQQDLNHTPQYLVQQLQRQHRQGLEGELKKLQDALVQLQHSHSSLQETHRQQLEATIGALHESHKEELQEAHRQKLEDVFQQLQEAYLHLQSSHSTFQEVYRHLQDTHDALVQQQWPQQKAQQWLQQKAQQKAQQKQPSPPSKALLQTTSPVRSPPSAPDSNNSFVNVRLEVELAERSWELQHLRLRLSENLKAFEASCAYIRELELQVYGKEDWKKGGDDRVLDKRVASLQAELSQVRDALEHGHEMKLATAAPRPPSPLRWQSEHAASAPQLEHAPTASAPKALVSPPNSNLPKPVHANTIEYLTARVKELESEKSQLDLSTVTMAEELSSSQLLLQQKQCETAELKEQVCQLRRELQQVKSKSMSDFGAQFQVVECVHSVGKRHSQHSQSEGAPSTNQDRLTIEDASANTANGAIQVAQLEALEQATDTADVDQHKVEIAPLHQPIQSLHDKVSLHGVARHEDSFYDTYSVDHKDVNVIAMLQQRQDRHRTVVQELETRLMQVASQLLDLEIANSNLTIKNQNMEKEISALKSENAQLIQENMGRKCRHVGPHVLTTDDGAPRHVLDADPLCENSQLLHMHAPVREHMSSVRAAANDEEQSPGTSGTFFSRPSSDSPQPPPRSPIRPFDAVVSSSVLLSEQGERGDSDSRERGDTSARGDSDTTLLVRPPEVAPASTPEDATARSSSATVYWRNSFQPEAFEEINGPRKHGDMSRDMQGDGDTREGSGSLGLERSGGIGFLRDKETQGEGSGGLGLERSAGIGLLLTQDTPTGHIFVKEIVAGSAAAEDGRISVGDRLISVDGHSLQGIHLKRVWDRMRGPDGSKISLEIRKGIAKARLWGLREDDPGCIPENVALTRKLI